MTRKTLVPALATVACAGLLLAGQAIADPARDAILATFLQQAKAADASFAGFSADAGKAFFMDTHTGGKPDTPSCTTCHTKNVKAKGQTRAGKDIDPMAVSKTPDRFTDAEKVAKWLLRNCTTVLGRECTPVEKGNVITFLASQ